MLRNGVLGVTLALLATMPATAGMRKAPVAQAAKPTPTPTATATPTQYTPEEMFAKVDGNADGRITRQEMQLFGMANNLGALINARTWKRVDKDRNGTLSREEFVAQIKKVRQQAAARAKRKA
jgi:hypothetical protein